MKITSNPERPFQPDRSMLSNSDGVSEAAGANFPPSPALYAHSKLKHNVKRSEDPRVAKVAHKIFAHFNKAFGRSRS